MGLWSALFGSDAAKRAAILQEIDLTKAVEAHIHWKLRLQSYVDGKSSEQFDPKVIGRDDQCDLGKWINGAGDNHFHDVPAFSELRADHAHFHAVAGNVVKEMQAKNKAGADALLKGEYARISHKVVAELTDLNKAATE